MLEAIKKHGTVKPAARENMPGTTSLFGYQFEQDLTEGFPALTTKQLYWKGVVVELLWFLRGDTNIKYLDDHKVRKMWHQDAYNYYCKIAKANDSEVNSILKPLFDFHNEIDSTPDAYRIFTFEEFCDVIKNTDRADLPTYGGYILGDCGYQYGKVWRNWETINYWVNGSRPMPAYKKTDQILILIQNLLNNPQGRRHVLTSWDPAHIGELALEWCHVLCQFNCRPLSLEERIDVFLENGGEIFDGISHGYLDSVDIQKYHLDSKMHQRSADVFLGVPLNTASYSLLTHMMAQIANFIAGKFIHSFGDVHIYDDHHDAVNLQLSRTPKALPKLVISDSAKQLFHNIASSHRNGELTSDVLTSFIDLLRFEDFVLEDYHPEPKIEANLSTGMVKQ